MAIKIGFAVSGRKDHQCPVGGQEELYKMECRECSKEKKPQRKVQRGEKSARTVGTELSLYEGIATDVDRILGYIVWRVVLGYHS